MPKGVREPLVDRFWRSVEKTDGCWIWIGSRQKHLFLGTAADNQQDMAKKFRSRTKLTPEQVREIRNAPNGARDLARIYGLKSHKTIYNIKKGLIFRHV